MNANLRVCTYLRLTETPPVQTDASLQHALSGLERSIRLDIFLQLSYTLYQDIKVLNRREERLVPVIDTLFKLPMSQPHGDTTYEMVSSLSLRYSAHLEISPLATQLPHGIALQRGCQQSSGRP